ncbi:hypothetical protein Bca52824_011218 [Brassica carinata]|uniref:SIAH-type domain-containing protein n=1 Tax=Brassica carinata TaxID=52824 RepID=A0A8X7WFW3_BRACI|nr:hypothetical protein Bca52824_011218 [Brassica carinata]
MDRVGPCNNWQSLDSYLDNIRLRLCRLEDHVLEVPCANTEFGCPANVTCFAMQRHLQQCEYSSTLEGRCVCPFSGCSFIGTYRKLYDHASRGHSDDLQMIECGETVSISFANHQRVVLKEQSSGGGELIVVDRLIKKPGAHFNVRCISPNVPGMGNFSWKLTVRLECTFASSQLPHEPFVVPSFMGPATELLILINRVESVV